MDFQKLLWVEKGKGLLSKPIALGSSRGQVSLTMPEAEPVTIPVESEQSASSQPTSRGAKSVVSEELGSKRKKEQKEKRMKKKKIP